MVSGLVDLENPSETTDDEGFHIPDGHLGHPQVSAPNSNTDFTLELNRQILVAEVKCVCFGNPLPDICVCAVGQWCCPHR